MVLRIHLSACEAPYDKAKMVPVFPCCWRMEVRKENSLEDWSSVAAASPAWPSSRTARARPEKWRAGPGEWGPGRVSSPARLVLCSCNDRARSTSVNRDISVGAETTNIDEKPVCRVRTRLTFYGRITLKRTTSLVKIEPKLPNYQSMRLIEFRPSFYVSAKTNIAVWFVCGPRWPLRTAGICRLELASLLPIPATLYSFAQPKPDLYIGLVLNWNILSMYYWSCNVFRFFGNVTPVFLLTTENGQKASVCILLIYPRNGLQI